MESRKISYTKENDQNAAQRRRRRWRRKKENKMFEELDQRCVCALIALRTVYIQFCVCLCVCGKNEKTKSKCWWKDGCGHLKRRWTEMSPRRCDECLKWEIGWIKREEKDEKWMWEEESQKEKCCQVSPNEMGDIHWKIFREKTGNYNHETRIVVIKLNPEVQLIIGQVWTASFRAWDSFEWCLSQMSVVDEIFLYIHFGATLDRRSLVKFNQNVTDNSK